MRSSKVILPLLTLACAVVLAVSLPRTEARPAAAGAVAPPAISGSSIGGVVSSTKGAEAGVWVIAEATDLPTRFVKIVVTDDQGRFVLPDMPKANYKVWVRGYGLVDSKPVSAAPGKTVSLTATIAPSAKAAAQYYPASYWYSMIQVPPKSAFPMEKEGIMNQLDWIATMKASIQFTQVGDKATRELPETLGKFNSSQEGWEAWSKTGEAPLNAFSSRLPRAMVLKEYADWTDRIAAGEIPPAPPRPQGVERNVVISEWDTGNDKSFIHDVTATDPRNPSLNANGVVYGVEQFSADKMDILDPVNHKWTDVAAPMLDHNMPANWGSETRGADAPVTWGQERVRPAVMRLHNTMMDQKGRIWITAKFRTSKDQPTFCKEGSSNASAKYYPLGSNGNGVNSLQVEMFDPESRKFTMVDTCYSTMHLEFAEDADNTLWFSGGSQVIGWLNTKVYDETGSAEKAQGWCPYVVDTNGNGKVDDFVGPDDPLDPTKDKRIRGGSYGMTYNPADGSIWEGTAGVPGYILRIEPGKNPPYTCKTEIYNSPTGTSTPKGLYADRNGVIWVAFAGSGHLGSFDRRKCKVLNGPTAVTGDQCPEGWTLYATPGPKMKGVTEAINGDWHYLNWVDQFDTLGFGKNTPITAGTNSDSLITFLTDSKKFAVLRVPYPLGFYSRGELSGRIDDPRGGWKGRGLWTNYASISPWNVEGGKGQTPKFVKFQVRPDPLAN